MTSLMGRAAFRLLSVSLASLGSAYQPALRRPSPALSRAPAQLVRLLARSSSSSASGGSSLAKPPPSSSPAAAAAAMPIVLPTNEQSERLLRIRHTSAHLMAMAVQKLFKDAKVTIGPWIEKGFYYDFDCPTPFQEKDLKKIKKEMDRLIQMKLPLVREEVTEDEARRRIEEQNEPYIPAGTWTGRRLGTYSSTSARS